MPRKTHKYLTPKPLGSVVLATASAAGSHGKHGKARIRAERRELRQSLRRGEW